MDVCLDSKTKCITGPTITEVFTSEDDENGRNTSIELLDANVESPKDETKKETSLNKTEDDEVVCLDEEIVNMGFGKKKELRSRIKDSDIEMLIVKCTACNKQVFHKYLSEVKKHCHLGVLICQNCSDFYKDGTFSQDESGDKYCRWCGQGGTLIACDFCHNAFCNMCIRRNFGRGEASRIQKIKWHCYICNPSPLKGLVSFCNMILDYAQRMIAQLKKSEHLKRSNANKKLRCCEMFLKCMGQTKKHMENKSLEIENMMTRLQRESKGSDHHICNSIGKMNILMFNHLKFVKHICSILNVIEPKHSFEKNSPLPEKKKNEKEIKSTLPSFSESKNEQSFPNKQHAYLDRSSNISEKSHNKTSKEHDDQDVSSSNEASSNKGDPSMTSNDIINKLPQIIYNESLSQNSLLKDEKSKNMLETKAEFESNLHSKSQKGLFTLLESINDETASFTYKNDKERNTPELSQPLSKTFSEINFSESSKHSTSSDHFESERECLTKPLIKSDLDKNTKISNEEAKNLLISLLDSDYDDEELDLSSVKVTCSLNKLNDNFIDSNKTSLQKYPIVLLNKLTDDTVKEYLSKGSIQVSSHANSKKQNGIKDSIEKEIANLTNISNLEKKNNTNKFISDEDDASSEKSNKQKQERNKAAVRKNEKVFENLPYNEEPESDEISSDGSLNQKIQRMISETSSNLKIESHDESFQEESDFYEQHQTSKKMLKKKTSERSSDKEHSSDDLTLTKKNKYKYHRLLKMRLSDSDEQTTDSLKSTNKRLEKSKRKRHSADLDSSSSSNGFSNSSSSYDPKILNKEAKQRKRKCLKLVSLSSDEDEQSKQELTPKGRKNIHKIISNENLKEETKAAAQAEKERRKRVLERQKLYNQIIGESKGHQITNKLVLEYDKDTKKELVEIHPDLIVKLKPHQINGIKFMWECTIESLDQLSKNKGSGCVLAHCMGLGKTLQVIVFLHTILYNVHTRKYLRTALILCPCNTLLNWAQEFENWLPNHLKLKLHVIKGKMSNKERAEIMAEWKESGGVLIMGYDIFRSLNCIKRSKSILKKIKDIFTSCLLDPGPDIVICDEGHVLKNTNCVLAKITNSIKCRRRIILTGTPLQNNLTEYHCMVDFVKPNLLGTKKEFKNRFVHPIMNGQCADSNYQDVKLMKKRVHILHSLLEGCVQRCDYNVLCPFLPPKYEYVISIRLSETQIKMYQHYLEHLSRGKNREGSAGTFLFWDFNNLRQIWTHPYTFYLNEKKKMRQDLLYSDEENESISYSSSSSESTSHESLSDQKHSDEKSAKEVKKRKEGSCSSSKEEEISIWKDNEKLIQDSPGFKSSEVNNGNIANKGREDWWNQFCNVEEESTNPLLSGKVSLLLDILQECETIGDKVLLFSQSLLTLDMIEIVLKDVDQKNESIHDENDQEKDFIGTWIPGLDYFRIDGSTNVDRRKKWIHIFNKEDNLRARLFMISTKAGSLGTNLIGANRVIIMDASWNPTHDIQAIFRVYRFGQKKPVYVYRFLAQGTMEEKIYDRQVTKQSLSYRVLDEQQIDRHFNAADLAELYSFNPDNVSNRPTPLLPKDRLFADLLMRHKEWISTYHEHDSLLQNIVEEDLTEEERKLAWQEFEAEKEGKTTNPMGGIRSSTLDLKALGLINIPILPYDKVDKLPDAKLDIEKLIHDIKKIQPNISQDDLTSKLFAALNILRRNYLLCYELSTKQKHDFILSHKPIPQRLGDYLCSLETFLRKSEQVLQTINAQNFKNKSRPELLKKGLSHHNASGIGPTGFTMSYSQNRPFHYNPFSRGMAASRSTNSHQERSASDNHPQSSVTITELE